MKKFEEAERIQIVAPAAWVRAVDEWRRRQEDLPGFSEAVRRLVERGLKVKGSRFVR